MMTAKNMDPNAFNTPGELIFVKLQKLVGGPGLFIFFLQKYDKGKFSELVGAIKLFNY